MTKPDAVLGLVCEIARRSGYEIRVDPRTGDRLLHEPREINLTLFARELAQCVEPKARRV